jgi:hypothetical protein
MRPRFAGLALAGAFALLTAACGSQQPSAFHPAGATLPAATPSSSDAAQADVPQPFPGKVSFEFDALPSDPDQAAVVTRDRDFLLSYYDAIYTKGQSKAYESYISNNGALKSVQASVTQHVDAGQGFAGADKHFDTTVTPTPYYPGEENVNYCVDEAGLRYTNIKTGQALGNSSAPGQEYYLETDTFAKDAHTSWDLVGILVTPYPKGQARECKP